MYKTTRKHYRKLTLNLFASCFFFLLAVQSTAQTSGELIHFDTFDTFNTDVWSCEYTCPKASNSAANFLLEAGIPPNNYGSWSKVRYKPKRFTSGSFKVRFALTNRPNQAVWWGIALWDDGPGADMSQFNEINFGYTTNQSFTNSQLFFESGKRGNVEAVKIDLGVNLYDGQFHEAALTYDENHVSFYFDGKLIHTITDKSVIPTDPMDFIIGPRLVTGSASLDRNFTEIVDWTEISEVGASPTPTPTTTPTPTPTTTPGPAVQIPAKMEAEDYTSMSGIQTELTADNGGGLNVGWVDPSDWLSYDVKVNTAGTYTIEYRVATTAEGAQITLNQNGATLNTTTLPNTGGWQNWTTVSTSVYLSAGTHTMQLLNTFGNWNVNWWAIKGGTQTLTDITDLNGNISAQYSDSPANENIDKVIDNSSSTKYLTFHSSGWIQYEAPSKYMVSRYSIRSANDVPSRDPLSWSLLGSIDGTNWVTLDSRNNEDFPNRFQKRSFEITNQSAYSYFRLSMNNNSGTILQLSEWELFGEESVAGENLMTSPTQNMTYEQSAGIPFSFEAAPEVAHILLYSSEDYVDIATLSAPFEYTWFPAVTGPQVIKYEYYDSDWNFLEVGSRNIEITSSSTIELTTIATNDVLNGSVHFNAIVYDKDIGNIDGDGILNVVFDIVQGAAVVATRTESIAPYDWYFDTTSIESGNYELRVTSTSTVDAGNDKRYIAIPISISN